MAATEHGRIERAAALLIALRRPGPRPISLPTELAPRDESEAYAIQHATAQRLGEVPGGWKVAMDDPQRGTSAPVWRSVLLDSPATADSAVAGRLGIEPEIAFRLGRDLPPLAAGRQYSLEAVLDAVESAHAAIEIVVSRFQSHAGAALLDRLADQISNGGLVVGPPCRDWRHLDLRQLPLRLTLSQGASHCERDIVGGHPLGDPLLPLHWLTNHCSARGLTLRAGEIITTGSCAGLSYLGSGGEAMARFEPLGSAQLRVR